jgi:hypothetical protein
MHTLSDGLMIAFWLSGVLTGASLAVVIAGVIFLHKFAAP